MSVEFEMKNMQERMERLERTNRRLEQTNRNLEQTIRDRKPVNAMFKAVSLEGSEVSYINHQHDYSLDREILPASNCEPTDRTGFHLTELASYNVHEQLRLMALSVYGTKKSTKIQTRAEQEDVARIYDCFKQVWLEEYNRRLDNLEA